MAPVPEAYFAPLDKCFSGDVQLLSWKRVFLYLCDSEKQDDDAGSAHAFLRHPESIRLLTNSLTPFAPSSPKSKSEFESKTAAIHVDTSPQAPYSLDEIKSDALWLSKCAGIDEVTALRITVLEWQGRPNARLLARFSEEEATSLQDATGVNNFRVSLAGPQVKDALRIAAGGSEDLSSSSSEKSRRLRLRHLYLSERNHILKTSRKLLSLSLRDLVPCDASRTPNPPAKETTRQSSLQSLGEDIFKDQRSESQSRQLLSDAVEAVKKRLQDLQTEGGWLNASESDVETETTWRTTLIDETVHIMQIMFLNLQSSHIIPSGGLVLSWLQLMAECSFMESISVPCEDPLTLILSLQALAAATTLAFLKLPVSLTSVWQNAGMSQAEVTSHHRPYFLSREHIAEINEIFLNTISTGILSASPAVFAWGTILHTMRDLALSAKETREMEQFHNAVDSFQSNTPSASPLRGTEQTLYEELLDVARVPSYGDDFVAILTTGAIDRGQVFEVIINLASRIGKISAVDDFVTNLWIRSSLLAVVKVSSLFLEYSPELIDAALSILRGSTDSLRGRDDIIAYPSDPRFVFLHDSELMDRIFHVARSRFPYESIPFLRLCRALTGKDEVNGDNTPAILQELEAMETFTQMVSPDFQGYETIREDENANLVSLVRPIPMIASAAKSTHAPSRAATALVVAQASELQPATTGQVISESRPAVIMWYHEYSCLTFLGSWLEEWANNSGTMPIADDDTVAEIIGLFTDLMAATQSYGTSDEDGSGPKKILEIASDGLSNRGDIISVIFDILERNLQTLGLQSGIRGTLDLAVSCLQFVRVLVSILPNRVWPFLSRSSLLGSDGQGGRVTAVVSASEVASGDYPFLISCIDLFNAVTEDAVAHAAIRRASGRALSRSGTASDSSAGVPSHVISNVLLGFVRVMTEVYNSDANWRFNEPEKRLQIDAHLACSFEKIIYYAHGIDETDDPQSRITGIFYASSLYILDILRPQSNDEMPFNPVLRIVIDGLQTPTSTVYLRQLEFIEKQLKATLRLAIKLIQAAQLVGSPVSLLEEQLFKAAPALVKLYGSHDGYRLPVIILLDLLVSRAAADAETEPPSLLGHLGAESSCLFLDVLAQFDKPLNDSNLFISIWRLLSTFVSKRQQWLAVYLLTGSSPRDALRKTTNGNKAPAMRGTPFLKIALDTLANIGQVDSSISLALLEFVSQSQEHWSWATPQLGSHPKFFSSLVNYVAHLKLTGQLASTHICLTQIAATTADLCAIYLHTAKEARDKSFFRLLIPLVSWYAENAVDVSGYNASLHSNLRKNLEMKYSGCKLQNFKRTALESPPLGRNYYYDMCLSAKLLSFDFAWKGKRNQGFADEFERANLNLSLVEAQVNLFNSWKFFAIEHAMDFVPDSEAQKSMILVVRNCLTSNTRTVPQEAIFSKLQQRRVDFALSLLQRLVEVDASGQEVRGLLEVVWDAMRARGTTYENALIHDDTEYYRGLLNILFLALQFHVAGPSSRAPEPVNKRPELSSDLSIILEIVKVVIAQGFRSLTTYLHDEPQKCSPKDFAILTAILQTALRVKNAERLYEHIVYHIEDNDTARYATTLYSWADQLTVEGDPVYGELSIIFLVELSAIPMLAEYLAVEAVLMKLSTSRLTRVLGQPKGCGPFDPVPRLYAIWTDGFLPLCLNLLFHVNRAAPEVAAFLNQFEGQLNRAAESFAGVHAPVSGNENAKKVSLSMASEAYSLSLISFILQRYREAGPSAGVDSHAIQDLKWDKSQIKEDIEELLGRRSSLRTRIVATNEKELELARQKPANSALGAENRLEEKIVQELQTALTCLSGGEDPE